MPRKARIDVPGAFHHIICRGIERRKIFYDNADCDNFLERLENILILKIKNSIPHELPAPP
jgi:putative transposase